MRKHICLLLNANYFYMQLGIKKTMDSDETIDIYDVYRIGQNSETILKKFGTWSTTYGLRITDPNIWSRRESLEGHRFR